MILTANNHAAVTKAQVTDFYVYVYFNPLKPQTVDILGKTFQFKPFYVGKGRGDRCQKHLCPSLTNSTSAKTRTIKKIFAAGLNPLVIKVAENLSEEQSFDIECFVIKSFGCKFDGSGFLTNLSHGGEGVVGYRATEEQRKRRGDRMKGSGNPNYGKHLSDKQKRQISEFAKTRIGDKNPNYGNGEKISGVNNPNYGKLGAANHCYGKRGYWADHKFSDTHLANMKKTVRRGKDNHNFGKPLSDSVKAKLRARFKGLPNTRLYKQYQIVDTLNNSNETVKGLTVLCERYNLNYGMAKYAIKTGYKLGDRYLISKVL